MRNKVIMILLLTSMLMAILLGCMIKHNPNEYNVIKAERILINSNDYLNKDELPPIEELNIPQNKEKQLLDEDNLVYIGEYKLTGYCDCEICQGPWVGTTALGVPPTEQWTIAVDSEYIPLGSLVVINGHTYRAEDTGSAINQRRIDIFCGSHEECYSEFCNGYADVYIVVE